MTDAAHAYSSDLDRQFWRGRAQHDVRLAFEALECGHIAFDGWKRVFLYAAIDHFRDHHFEQSARSAQRILQEEKLEPFTGRFTQEKSLEQLRPEFQELLS